MPFGSTAPNQIQGAIQGASCGLGGWTFTSTTSTDTTPYYWDSFGTASTVTVTVTASYANSIWFNLNSSDWQGGQLGQQQGNLQGQGMGYESQMANAQQARNQAAQQALPQQRPPTYSQLQVNSAAAKARTLLLSVLSPEQRAEYTKSKTFIVRGNAGGLYRITHGRIGNVIVLNAADFKPTHALCAHPDGVPIEDVLVAQLLHLRDDEAAFGRVANWRQVAA